MQTAQEHIAELWNLYLTDQASPDQVKELLAMLRQSNNDEENDRQFRESLAALEKGPSHPAGSEELAEVWQSLLKARPSLDAAWKNQLARKEEKVDKHRIGWYRGLVAAAVLLALGTGLYFWISSPKQDQALVAVETPADIAPGKNGAILTLADGSQVVLDSLGNGVIASQSGAQVRLQDGQLAYDPASVVAGITAYNTLSTPNGRQFQLVLPDGTKVWLNAASSIRYPIVFGKERRVAITGEAYFEVVRNTQIPFLVEVNRQAEIQVLGTSFNVNAYGNEDHINTTLLEGSVSVTAVSGTNGSKNRPPAVVLKPGQLAQIINTQKNQAGGTTSARNSIRVINDTDVDEAIAWKNGLFDFKGKGLEEVMRQLERWYDIEVVYENGIPDIRFGGELSRDVSLAGLLNGLKGVGLQFRIEEGRRLVVKGG